MPGSEVSGVGEARPEGLVTLIVGAVGRSGGGRSARSTVPAPAAQWSCRWSSEGPGPVLAGPPGELGEADLTLSLSPQDAELVRQGRLAPSVAFMQGRLKTAGDNALLLSVLSWTNTPAFAHALAGWEAGAGGP